MNPIISLKVIWTRFHVVLFQRHYYNRKEVTGEVRCASLIHGASEIPRSRSVF